MVYEIFWSAARILYPLRHIFGYAPTAKEHAPFAAIPIFPVR